MSDKPVMWTFHVSCEAGAAARLVSEMATAHGYAMLAGESLYRARETDGSLVPDSAYQIKVFAPPSSYEAIKARMIQFANDHGQKWLCLEIGAAELFDTGHRDRIITHTFREEDVTL